MIASETLETQPRDTAEAPESSDSQPRQRHKRNRRDRTNQRANQTVSVPDESQAGERLEEGAAVAVVSPTPESGLKVGDRSEPRLSRRRLRFQDLVIGDRVFCQPNDTYATVTALVGKYAELTWEHNSQTSCYTEDDLKRLQIARIKEGMVSKGSFAEAYEAEVQAIAPTSDNAFQIAPTSPLDHLAADIEILMGQIEQAEEVANAAAKSALEFAREMGEKLLQAKKQLKEQVGHGKWEEWRKSIKSPRSGRELPSSTATLYQRIAQRWQELGAATTLREAQALLKSDRALKSATAAETPTTPVVVERDLTASLEQLKGQFDANQAQAESRYCKLYLDDFGSIAQLFALKDLGEVQEGDRVTVPHGKYEGRSAVVKQVYESYVAAIAAESQLPPVCKPSITPAGSQQEMQAHAAQFGGCHSCKYRVLTGSGDRYRCEMGEFGDEVETLPLKQNWFELNEGCKSFAEPSRFVEKPIDFVSFDIKKAITAHGAKEVALAALRACSEAERAEVGNWLIDFV